MSLRHAFLLTLVVASAAACASGPRGGEPAADGCLTTTYRAPLCKVTAAAREALAQTEFHVKEDQRVGEARWRVVASETVDAGPDAHVARVVLDASLGDGAEVSASIAVDRRVPGAQSGARERELAESIRRRMSERLPGAAPAGRK